MPKRKHHKGGPEITFDPEARRSYLRGFSERKKQRRAYGLAMQKVKDRQEKLTERKERKQSLLEQIEQSEKAKMELLEGVMAEDGRLLSIPNHHPKKDNDSSDQKKTTADTTTTTTTTTSKPKPDTNIKKYEDKETEQRWGGRVVVTTSTSIPGDDSDDDDNNNNDVAAPAQPRRRGRKDKDQEYAGSVDRFLSQTVKNLPKSKAQQRSSSHKGKHGASDMKGVGGAAGLQAAQKILKRSQGKGKKEGKKKKRR